MIVVTSEKIDLPSSGVILKNSLRDASVIFLRLGFNVSMMLWMLFIDCPRLLGCISCDYILDFERKRNGRVVERDAAV
jgi:hypothetical protein